MRLDSRISSRKDRVRDEAMTRRRRAPRDRVGHDTGDRDDAKKPSRGEPLS
jgi:hypothetical protein